MENMNIKQQKALSLAETGHSFALFGQAGTGKSYAIIKIHQRLVEMGKTVGITATTGIAATHFQRNLGAMTIHRYIILKIDTQY